MAFKNLTLKSISLFLVASSSLAAYSFALAFRWTQTSFASEPYGATAATILDSNKEQDGLAGPVHRVRTERARLLNKSGKLSEGARELMEATTYDLQGNRTDNSYYLIPSSSSSSPTTGAEEYKYDDKGNMVEMTVRDRQNSIVSREVYTYEFDAVGNWTKMNTFLVVFEAGRLSYEPVDVTYRNITYYYNQTIADITGHSQAHRAGSNEGRDSSASAVGSLAQPGMKDDAASLGNLLDEWITATNARNIEKQVSFYAPTLKAYYRARNVSREFVRSDKARAFQRADVIDIHASAPEIMFDDEGRRTATMRFHKQYVIEGGGQDRRGEVLQELRWQLTDGGWKITSERDVRVLR